MVEAEPALLHLLGQGGKALVERGPIAEVLQSGRTAFQQRLFQMEEAFIVHVMVEVHVHPRRRVVQEEPARLGEGELVRLRVDEGGSDGKGCLHQDLRGILRQAGGLNDLRQGHVSVTQPLQDAELDHQAAGLEHDGAERDVLRQPLRIAGGQAVHRVNFLDIRKKMHTFLVPFR